MPSPTSARPRRASVAALAVVALSLVAAATAGAQQQPAPRFAPVARPAVVGAASQPADSAAHYRRQARVQRLTGGALAVAGVAAIAGAYVQYARGGGMGMTGAQAATFAAGAGLGVLGGRRWDAARESAAAARGRATPTAAQR